MLCIFMKYFFQVGLTNISDESYSIWDEINDIKKVDKAFAEQKPLWEIGEYIFVLRTTIMLLVI